MKTREEIVIDVKAAYVHASQEEADWIIALMNEKGYRFEGSLFDEGYKRTSSYNFIGVKTNSTKLWHNHTYNHKTLRQILVKDLMDEISGRAEELKEALKIIYDE